MYKRQLLSGGKFQRIGHTVEGDGYRVAAARLQGVERENVGVTIIDSITIQGNRVRRRCAVAAGIDQLKYLSLIHILIGVVEVLKVAQQIIEANRMSSPNAAFGIYLVVFLLYFLACWPISLLASYLEKKWR